MSLEAKIEALTAAITEQTAFLKSMKSGGTAAASSKPAASGGSKPASSGKKITLDTIKEKFGAYLGIEDKKERKLRAANVTALNQHFGVEKVSELEEDQWVEALKALKAFEAGDKPDFMNEDGDDDGDGDDEALV